MEGILRSVFILIYKLVKYNEILDISQGARYVWHRDLLFRQTGKILDCTRQNIDDLVKRERLEPISVSARNKLFLKAQVEEKRW